MHIELLNKRKQNRIGDHSRDRGTSHQFARFPTLVIVARENDNDQTKYTGRKMGNGLRAAKQGKKSRQL